MRISNQMSPQTLERQARGELLADGGSLTDYLPIRDYARILYRRKWLILAIVAVALFVAVAINRTTTPVYQARATLQIDVGANILGFDRPLLPLDQRDWMRELPTQLAILQSRELARMAREQLQRARTASTPADQSPAANVNGGPAPQPQSASDHPLPSVGQIVAGRSVSAVKDTRLVNVSFRSTDPVLTASVANALAQAYLQQNLRLRSQTSGDASESLTKLVEEQKKRVAESESALQRFREQHRADALFTDQLGAEQQNIVVQQLGQLQAEVTKAQTETIAKEALYRQVVAANGEQAALEAIPAIASNAHIQGLKQELATSQRLLGQASKELGVLNPDLIKLQEGMQNTERRLRTEIFNLARAIQNDFEAARAREGAVARALNRQQAEVRTLNSKAAEYSAIEREATTNRDVLDKLQQREREASLAGALESGNVRIVEWAEVPTSPALPRKTRNLTVALVSGGTFALALVFGLQLFNTRVTSTDDVKRHLQIPVLGILPRVPALQGLFLGNGTSAQFHELIQGIRTNLLMTRDLATGRVLLVTSAEPGEGKSMASANLAASFARLKQRVLLIDTDMRNPRLHEVLDETQQPGLSDVLVGKVTTPVFRKTKVPGVWLLPAGTPSRNPADLLGSQRLNELVQSVRPYFDWIVLDSPPVLAVTDPCLIAQAASAVLLVVDCGRTNREVASAALERLDAVNANVVGVVLNRAILEPDDDSYLPYYHRDYPTYDSQQEDTFSPPELPAGVLTESAAPMAPKANS
jgi:succinoglycan biosynthesis transport protein ExoP